MRNYAEKTGVEELESAATSRSLGNRGYHLGKIRSYCINVCEVSSLAECWSSKLYILLKHYFIESVIKSVALGSMQNPESSMALGAEP